MGISMFYLLWVNHFLKYWLNNNPCTEHNIYIYISFPSLDLSVHMQYKLYDHVSFTTQTGEGCVCYEKVMHEYSYTAGNWNRLCICMLSCKFVCSKHRLRWGPPKKLLINIFAVCHSPPLLSTCQSSHPHEHFRHVMNIYLQSPQIQPFLYISIHYESR